MNVTAETASLTPSKRALAGKYLTFMLNDVSYGLEILKVREIIGMLKITSVPDAPHDVKGIVNLRGKVIHVVDLRLRFGLPEADQSDESCIIVVNVNDHLVGVLVDTVSEVLDLVDEQIEEAPDFNEGGAASQFIVGIAKVNEEVKILLDIEKVLGNSGLGGF